MNDSSMSLDGRRLGASVMTGGMACVACGDGEGAVERVEARPDRPAQALQGKYIEEGRTKTNVVSFWAQCEGPQRHASPYGSQQEKVTPQYESDRIILDSLH